MSEQWRTYRQAAEFLGVTPEAARRQASRGKWRVQRGNDGKALGLVPDHAAILARSRPPVRTGVRPPVRLPEHFAAQPPVRSPVQPEPVSGQDDLVAELRRRAETAEAAALATSAEVTEQRERASRVEGEAVALREALAREHEAAERHQAERNAALAEIVTLAARAAKVEGEAAALRDSAAREQQQVAAVQAALQAAERAREAAEAEAAGWMAGGPLTRALRALIYRRS